MKKSYFLFFFLVIRKLIETTDAIIIPTIKKSVLFGVGFKVSSTVKVNDICAIVPILDCARITTVCVLNMSKKKKKKEVQKKPEERKRFVVLDKKSTFEKSAEEFGVELKQATRSQEVSYCNRCGYKNLPTDEKCFNCRSPLHIYTDEFSELEELEEAKKKFE